MDLVMNSVVPLIDTILSENSFTRAADVASREPYIGKEQESTLPPRNTPTLFFPHRRASPKL